MIELTKKEWVELGTKLFGEDMMQWRFVCPVCGNVQTPEDFKKFKDQGADPNSATCECIGRYLPDSEKAFGNKKRTKGKPCNYAGYGLFQLSPVSVEGVHCFAFEGQEIKE